MGQAMIVKPKGKTGRLGVTAWAAIKTWKHVVNYKAFHDINKEKLKLSYVGIISFSNYMAYRIRAWPVIVTMELSLQYCPLFQTLRRERCSHYHR
jgi:hypothetical protein